MPNINKVKTLLNNLSALAKNNPPLLDNGNLDVKKFNQLKEVKLVIDQLQKQGVDNDWLRDNGFVVTAMILKV